MIFLTELLQSLSPIAEWIVTEVTVIANTIVSTPLLLMTTGFLLIGGVIGIFGRMLSRN